MKLIASLLALSFALVSGVASARADTPLSRYRAESLSLRVEGFASQPMLMRDGAEVDYGFFGGGADEVFAGSPAALEHMGSYQDLRTGGFIAWTAGMATLVGVLVVLLADEDVFFDDPFNESPNGLFWGLFAGGAVVGFGGAFAMNAANTHLSNAVEAFNTDLFERLDQPPPQAGLGSAGARLTVRGRF